MLVNCLATTSAGFDAESDEWADFYLLIYFGDYELPTRDNWFLVTRSIFAAADCILPSTGRAVCLTALVPSCAPARDPPLDPFSGIFFALLLPSTDYCCDFWLLEAFLLISVVEF